MIIISWQVSSRSEKYLLDYREIKFMLPSFNVDVGIAKDRAWVLSTIRSASSVAQEVPPRLAFFESSVLGLARICDKLAATGPTSESKFHHQLVVNLWALFPSFCKCPSDIESALSTLTTTLGRALDDNRYPELLVSSVMILSLDDSSQHGAYVI